MDGRFCDEFCSQHHPSKILVPNVYFAMIIYCSVSDFFLFITEFVRDTELPCCFFLPILSSIFLRLLLRHGLAQQNGQV